MSEKIEHEIVNPLPWMPFGLHNFIAWLFGIRFILYAYDLWMMRFTYTKRHRQLAETTLKCRYCFTEIDLMGLWQCECGYTRPGNYYGRCPKCLGHPEYIDCPACKATMDVR